jgi:PBP1b-binding outer membrane lipoprotein LpoB
MKKILNLIFIVLILSSCSSTSPTHDMAQNTQNAINSIHQTLTNLSNGLSKECKTDATNERIKTIENQLISAKDQVKIIDNTCKLEIDNEKNKTEKWQICFYSLLFLVVGYIIIKIT